ncbi:hypothetical protein BaRGS_00033716 [Batillaria attramentaria]|uniref:Uncharacterized protein n=1 Tax=Batillaria attramentaria TaxID=370345 RepID=A0ABD0JJY6_9CAEN
MSAGARHLQGNTPKNSLFTRSIEFEEPSPLTRSGSFLNRSETNDFFLFVQSNRVLAVVVKVSRLKMKTKQSRLRFNGFLAAVRYPGPKGVYIYEGGRKYKGKAGSKQDTAPFVWPPVPLQNPPTHPPTTRPKYLDTDYW